MKNSNSNCPALQLESLMEHLENVAQEATASEESSCANAVKHILKHVTDHMNECHWGTGGNHDYYKEGICSYDPFVNF